ncbi:MAG: endolytic transglycosylase MltG [Acidimicrobiia bacterium]
MTVDDQIVRPGPPDDRPPADRHDADWHEDDWDAPDLVPVYDVELPVRSRPWVRRILAGVALLLVAALLIGGAIGMWMIRQVNPPGDAGDPVTFTVAETDDLESITNRLKEQGIITNTGVFDWYVKRKGGLEPVAGYYLIRPMDTMGNIVAVLRTPPAQTYTRVTFPEGFTIRQIGRRLSQTVTRLNEQAFVAAATDGSIVSAYSQPGQPSLEGLLFPDTYQVAGNETEPDVIKRLVELMERVGRQEGVDQAPNRLLRTPYEVLTIASMIEREAAVDEDRAKIARVIYNRLSRGMPLQIDATLYYGQDPDLPFDELRAIDSPYNTYLYPNLPPTPIANPGRASIRAAMNPAPNPLQTDPLCRDLPAGEPCEYIYYVLADENGGHAFAATLAQHEANVAAARAAGIIP